MLWLIGMMGSGKSSVGREVAAAHRLDFIDTDALVSSVTESSVADVWSTDGEATFRRLESQMIASAAAGKKVVVATGGGVVLDPQNIATMRDAGLVVWLKASPSTLAARLGEGTGRPLLAGADDPVGVLRELLATREDRYARAAHARVDTDDKPVAAVVDEVLELWTAS